MNNISKTIGWADKSWNPITGCLKGCSYCYARRIYQRFKKDFTPQIHIDRLGQPLKTKPSRIFVCSVSDFWGLGVKQIWREKVYDIMKVTPWHTYLILTKQPQRINDAKCIPENVWVGVSVSKFEDRWRAGLLCSKIQTQTFVSVEPLLEDAMSSYLLLHDWIIIGGLTPKPVHKKEWVQEIVSEAKRLHIPIFIKNNIHWHKKIQEFPCELPKGEMG